MTPTIITHNLHSLDILISVLDEDFNDIAWQCPMSYDTLDTVTIDLPPGEWTVHVIDGDSKYTQKVAS